MTPIDLDTSDESDAASLADILRGGGIEVVTVVDELGLPYDTSSGPLDPADLISEKPESCSMTPARTVALLP